MKLRRHFPVMLGEYEYWVYVAAGIISIATLMLLIRTMTQWVTPLVVTVGRMGELSAVWKNRPRILKRELPSGPSCSVGRPPVALTSAAPLTQLHEYYCSNNGNYLEI